MSKCNLPHFLKFQQVRFRRNDIISINSLFSIILHDFQYLVTVQLGGAYLLTTKYSIVEDNL